jgi:hypothetical protein
MLILIIHFLTLFTDLCKLVVYLQEFITLCKQRLLLNYLLKKLSVLINFHAFCSIQIAG